MSGMRLRKRGFYTGELAKPLEYRPLLPNLPLMPPVACEPDEADAWTVIRGCMQKHNAQIESEGSREVLNKIIALCEHFGIDLSRPGWALDLALSLGKRHEPELLFKGTKVSFSALFEKYKIDPGQDLARIMHQEPPCAA